jgi:hypothetical protein
MEKKYPIGEVRVYFVFKHPKTGEEMSSKLYTPLELLDTDLSIINERTCVCDCQPVGETNVVECNCEDYYQDFEFHSYHVELAQPPAEAERGEKVKIPVTIAIFDFIKDCAENWDHDTDGHRYDTGCRKCEAKSLYADLKQKKEMYNPEIKESGEKEVSHG